ncbi:MAG: hypothetical protein KKF65_06110, partial [Nanoarchaeota archaeon]|nr:hypothetical protein [Nanoarchaeota archaeon]
TLREEKLDKPKPLKYCFEKPNLPWYLKFSTYELDNIWVHLGYAYIEVVAKINPKVAKEYIHQYSKTIEKNHNFLELYDRKGLIYKTLFYIADEGMIWASMHLNLLEKFKS